MKELELLTMPVLLERSVKMYGENTALATVGSEPLTYNLLYEKIQAVIAFLDQFQVQKNSKVAILSTNMPNWVITYFALNSIGLTAVPLLPDFSVDEIGAILNHAGPTIVFVSDNLRYKLDKVHCPVLENVINIENYSVLKGKNVIYKTGAKPPKVYKVEEDDIASIIYTSGTTGKSKGVMLSHKNIVSNTLASAKVQEILPDDRFLSILPLSHAYENTIGLILPVFRGASIYYLSKPPTPAVLMPALQTVKPTLMLTVPLIIEKIFRKSVLGEINKKTVARLLYKIPLVRKEIHALAGKKLMQTFGGELKFFGIGGAKLDATVEKFLLEAKFPYAIGYGLTESAPLLAGANPLHTKLQSTGPFIEGVEFRLNEINPDTGEGEIWVKGPNIMKGYYKEPELTKEAITDDGWLKTGDLAMLDEQNFVYIKGRKKNTIVGANGENIYPEDIESLINNFSYVLESLVVEKKGKLVAMVHFNREEIEAKYQHLKEEVSMYVEHKINDLIHELHQHVNARVNKFSRLQVVVAQHEPFQKTATQKIKRYLY